MTKDKILSAIVIVIALAIVGFAIYLPSKNNSKDQVLVASFDDCAKAGYPVTASYPAQCRTASGELFVQKVDNTNPSPTTPLPQNVGFLSGHVTVGPICPVESVDHPCVASSDVYTSRQLVVFAFDSVTELKRVYLDAQGNYKIPIVAGNYYLRVQPAGIGPGEKKYVMVKPGETTTTNFDIDTGIR